MGMSLITLSFPTSTLTRAQNRVGGSPHPLEERWLPGWGGTGWHWAALGRGGCSWTVPIPQIQPELFLSELRRNYGGYEGAEVFSTAWNTLMVAVSSWEAPGGLCGLWTPDRHQATHRAVLPPSIPSPGGCPPRSGSTFDGLSLPLQFSCCGVLGPEDFGNGSRFQELHPGTPWPRACCTREGPLQAGELRGWEQCRERSPGYIHEQVGHDPAVSPHCPQHSPARGSRAVAPSEHRGRSLARCPPMVQQPSDCSCPQPRHGPPHGPLISSSELPAAVGSTREPLCHLSSTQGCFSTFGRTLQKYLSVPGTCSLAMLGIEVPSRDGGDRAGSRLPRTGSCSAGRVPCG